MLQILALRGFFEENKLESFGKMGLIFMSTRLNRYIPGVEAATGSLGLGFSMGIGMATAAKIQRENYGIMLIGGRRM